MKEWISELVAAAKYCRRHGNKQDAKKFMRRAWVIKTVLAQLGDK